MRVKKILTNYSKIQIAKVKSRKLRKVIKGFIKLYPKLAEAYYANGACWLSSENFIEYAKMKHLKAKIDLFRVDKRPPYAKYKDQHWVILIDDTIAIDFTARQFHSRFSFPRIWIDHRLKRPIFFPYRARNAPGTVQYV